VAPLIWLAAILITLRAGPAAAVAPPSISKTFSIASMPVVGIATLTITITNPNSADSLLGVAFQDNFPVGLVVATPNGLTSTCGGTPFAPQGGFMVSLAAGTIAPAGSCTVSVNVTGETAGTYVNFTGLVSSTNGGTGNSASATIRVRPTFAPSNAHDFDANGVSDIAWRQGGGTLAAWLMNGTQVLQAGSIGAVPSNWQIVGQRDFNADGRYDLLWRDGNTGTVAIWLLNGLQVSQFGNVGMVATTWSVAGTGNFNGFHDSFGDILWRDNLTGSVAIWLMNGLAIQQAGTIGALPSNWQIAGTGDFDADANCDVLWRDSNTGIVAIWLMNGLAIKQTGAVGAAPGNWQIVGTGDFNADAHWDILWRDTNTGTVAIWLMNGFSIMQNGTLGAVPNNWSIVETGDFDGDGFTDILWRDSNTGAVAIWFMNGLQVASTANLGPVGLDWTIQGLNAD
jgi:hypothetical protein